MPVSIVAGQKILASDFDDYEFMTAVWTAYTPVLTAATTSPTNYTSAGRYTRIGKTVIYVFQINAGASFTAGSGTYSISLPVNALLAYSGTSGQARLFDNSTGNAHLAVRTAVTAAATLGLQVTSTFGGALANVAHNVPWTWAASDIIDGFIIYEAA